MNMLSKRLKWSLLAVTAAVVAVVAAGAIALFVAQPDPAEAQGRPYRSTHRLQDRVHDATHPSQAEEIPAVGTYLDQFGPCTLQVTGDDPDDTAAARMSGGPGDMVCISRSDRALVTLTSPDAARPYRAYVTGGRAGMGDAFHAGVQANDGKTYSGSNATRIGSEGPAPLGRAGLAEYNGRLTAGGAGRRIELTRDMATAGCLMSGYLQDSLFNCAAAYVFVYTGADNAALSALPQKVGSDGLADLTGGTDSAPKAGPDMMVRVYFMAELNVHDTWIHQPGLKYVDGLPVEDAWRSGSLSSPQSLAQLAFSGSYNPLLRRTYKPALDREINLTGRWRPAREGMPICIHPRDYNNGPYYHPDGVTTVRLDYAPGTNFLPSADVEAETTYESYWGSLKSATIKRQVGNDGEAGWWEAAQETFPSLTRGACEYLYLDGFDPAGPMHGEVNVTFDDGVGGTHRLQPFTIFVKGPATSLNIMSAATRNGNGGDRSVRIRYEVADAMGHILESDDHLQNSAGRLLATGNLASATWRAADDATRAAIGSSGSGRDGLLVIPVRDDAPAGTYTVNITASANRNLTGSVSFDVPARPGQAPAPSQPAAVSVSVAEGSNLVAGGRAEFRYTVSDANGAALPVSAHPVTWSASDTAIVDTGDAARQSDGAFGFDIADNAAPGNYRVIVRTVAEVNGVARASGSVSFPIKGAPAAYVITGPDSVLPGGYAVYQVAATDANGNAADASGARGSVAIAVSGDAAGSVRVFNLSDGRLALDDDGVGRFRVRVNLAATADSAFSITATGVAGTTAGSKSVTVGSAAANTTQ